MGGFGNAVSINGHTLTFTSTSFYNIGTNTTTTIQKLNYNDARNTQYILDFDSNIRNNNCHDLCNASPKRRFYSKTGIVHCFSHWWDIHDGVLFPVEVCMVSMKK